MPSPRLLVIEGNSPQTMAEHLAAGGIPASENYANLLRELLPGAHVDACYPADLSAVLPQGQSLEGYDGVAITGSSLHLYNYVAEVARQVDLAKAIFETGTPLFGSCWGMQVISTKALAPSVKIPVTQASPRSRRDSQRRASVTASAPRRGASSAQDAWPSICKAWMIRSSRGSSMFSCMGEQ